MAIYYPPPQPSQGQHAPPLVQPGVAIAADDPPFDSRAVLWKILAAFQEPAYPAPIRPAGFISAGADTPLGAPYPWAVILQAWEGAREWTWPPPVRRVFDGTHYHPRLSVTFDVLGSPTPRLLVTFDVLGAFTRPRLLVTFDVEQPLPRLPVRFDVIDSDLVDAARSRRQHPAARVTRSTVPA